MSTPNNAVPEAKEDVWGMADRYSKQYGLDDTNVLRALIMQESGGNPSASVMDSNGQMSYGLLQWNMKGRGAGHKPADMLDPEYNIKGSMDEISRAYKQAKGEGLSGEALTMRVAQLAQRPAGRTIPEYGEKYRRLTGSKGSPTAPPAEREQRGGDLETIIGGMRMAADADIARALGPKELDFTGVRPWTDIAKQLDPMLSKRDYDSIREKYFYDIIAPRILEHGQYDVYKTWDAFKQATERESVVQGQDRFIAPLMRGALAAKKALVQPMAGFDKGAAAALADITSKEQLLDALLAREGLPAQGPEAVGNLIGMGVPLALAFEGAEPIAAGLASRFFSGAKAIDLASRYMKGGLAFAAYDAASAKNGERLVSGLEGALTGLAWEIPIAPLAVAGVGGVGAAFAPEGQRESAFISGALMAGGFKVLGVAGKAAESRMKATGDALLQGKPPATPEEHAVDQAMAVEAIKGAEIAKREGRPAQVTYFPLKQGGEVMMTQMKGGRTIANQAIDLADPAKAVESIKGLLDQEKGWEVGSIDLHPDMHPNLLTVLGKLAERSEGKYDRAFLGIPSNLNPAQAAEAIAKAGVQGVKAGEGGKVSAVTSNQWLLSNKWKTQPTDNAVALTIKEAKAKGVELSDEDERMIKIVVGNAWKGTAITDEHRALVAKVNEGMLPEKGLPAAAFIKEEEKKPESWELTPEEIEKLSPSDKLAYTRLLLKMSREKESKANAASAARDKQLTQEMEAFLRSQGKSPEEILIEKEDEVVAEKKESSEKRAAEVEALRRAPEKTVGGTVFRMEEKSEGVYNLFGYSTQEAIEKEIEGNPELGAILRPPKDILDTLNKVTEGPRGGARQKGAANLQPQQRKRYTSWLTKIASDPQKKAVQDLWTNPDMSEADKIALITQEKIPERLVPPRFREGYSGEEPFESGQTYGTSVGEIPSWERVEKALGEARTIEGEPLRSAQEYRNYSGELAKAPSERVRVLESLQKFYSPFTSEEERKGLARMLHTVPSLLPEQYRGEAVRFREGLEAMRDGTPPPEWNEMRNITGRKEYRLENVEGNHPNGDMKLVERGGGVYSLELEGDHPFFTPERQAAQGKVRQLESLGFEVPNGVDPDKPMIVLRKGEWNESQLYHEQWHAVGDVTNFNFEDAVPEAVRGEAASLARGLAQVGYENKAASQLVEEAYVSAATALRTNDQAMLEFLGYLNAGKQGVLRFANEMSERIYRLMESERDSAAGRRMYRMAEDVRRRSTREMSAELRLTGGVADFDPSSGKWRLYNVHDQPGYIEFKNAREMWDWFQTADKGKDLLPGWSFLLEQKGLKGPFVPTNTEPGRKLPLPEVAVDPRWYKANWGWQAMRGWVRPFHSWVATADQKLNEFFESKGGHLPLYEKVRAVDDAYRNGTEWNDKHRTELEMALHGISSGKQRDIFEFLSRKPTERTGQLINELKLDQKHLRAATLVESWMEKFGQETGIYGKNFMQDSYRQLKENNYNAATVKGWDRNAKPSEMGFWQKKVAEEQAWDPRNNHLAQFTNFLMESGLQKKYMDTPLKELRKILDMQNEDGRYILGPLRSPLENYYRYMKGYPDVTQQAINYAIGGFTAAVSKRLEKINSALPPALQFDPKFAPPQQIMNKYLMFSYAAGLGGRIAPVVRDMFQVFVTSMPVLGQQRFWASVAKVLSDGGESWQKAVTDGAMLNKFTIGDLYGDLLHETAPGSRNLITEKAQQVAGWMLRPQRWADNIARAISYTAEYDAALDAVRRYRAGEIDAGSLLSKTSLWFHDKPNQTRLIAMAGDRGGYLPASGMWKHTAEEVAREFGLEYLDIVHWPYRRGGQPAVLRTGLGRIFGQYGMWPMNYIDYMRRGISKFADPETRGPATRAMATWMATNFAAVSAMNGLGADVGQWFWASPGGYAGGPHLKFVQDLAMSFEESDQGRAARKRVLEYPLMSALPASGEVRAILRSMKDHDTGEGLLSPSTIRILGMRPVGPEVERGFWDSLKYETGFEGSRRIP